MALRTMLALALATLAAAPASQAAPQWAAAYYSAPCPPFAMSFGATPAIFSHQTVRQVVRVDASGKALRIRLTNELGFAPLRVPSVHVALVDEHGAVQPGSDHVVTFGGVPGAWIPTGAPLVGDPVELPVAALAHVAVTIYYEDSAMPAAHLAELQVAPGDQSGNEVLKAAAPMRGPGLVSEVDVLRDAVAPVIVALGDSITEGAASTPGADLSWPQQFAKRLAADPARRGWSIVNAGISGNRLLHEGFALPALARFDRDVLGVAGVTQVVLMEGINDIGWWNKPGSEVTADQLIAAYRQLVTRAHTHGLRVVGATLLPYKGAVYYTPEGEQMRQAVNEFIRHGGLFDDVIDFDPALADPADAQRLNPALEPGDHLHPNDAGYSAMAAAVRPEAFEPRR